MKKLINPDLQKALNLCERPAIDSDEIFPIIDEIFTEVKAKGDDALKKYTHFFDRVDIDQFLVEESVVNAAASEVSDSLKTAIQQAKSNIEVFHKAQKLKSEKIETFPGVVCWQESRPIEKVGIYIPGGTAPLFSTVLMLAVPGNIAGCHEIILCTPPGKEGKINPAILYTAKLCGVSKIYQVGGAQAIAAMTFGTEEIPAVNKIFGPGNQYVTCAKMRVQQYGVAIDMPAGPSEVLVLADESCPAKFVAADLLSQAEHGIDSQVICVVPTENLADQILKAVKQQLEALPRRELAQKSLENSVIIINDDLQFVIDFTNEYAAEHLIIAREDRSEIVNKINNAGSVFLGNYTPESAGDYASGTNHTLPTSAFAKAYSGVNIDAFTKKVTFQEISVEGLLNLGETIEIMAEAEQLLAHKNAVSIRLKKLRNED